MQEGFSENWCLRRPDKNTIVRPMGTLLQERIPSHEEAVKWREGLRPARSLLREGQPGEHSVFRRMFLPRWHSKIQSVCTPGFSFALLPFATRDVLPAWSPLPESEFSAYEPVTCAEIKYIFSCAAVFSKHTSRVDLPPSKYG